MINLFDRIFIIDQIQNVLNYVNQSQNHFLVRFINEIKIAEFFLNIKKE
jgi:hypothetical protein